MVKTSVVNLNNPNILTVNNDTTIGEDSTDLMVVNSNAEFTGSLTVNGESVSGGSGGGGGSGIVNNRIDGDLTIGEDSTDLMVVNSNAKFSNNVDVGTDLVVSNTISAKNVNEDIRNKAYTLNNKIDTHNDSWAQLGQDLLGEYGDNSGSSVSLSADGTIVAIGASSHDVSGLSSTTNEGRTRIYQYSSNGWTQLGAELVGDSGDNSGNSVSLSADGTIVAIGHVGYDVPGGSIYEGRTRIWKYRTVSQSEWESPNIFIATVGQTGVGDNNTTGGNRGEAYSETTKYWIQLGQDLIGESGDSSGSSVSLSADGTIVAIGAKYHNVDPTDSSSNYEGRTRIYQYSSDTTTWTKLGQDLVGETNRDYSGYSVSLSADGTIVAIGASGHNSSTGKTRIYQYSSNSWRQLGQDLLGDTTGNKSGYSVSLSADGTIVAISDYGYDVGTNTNEGRTRIYQYSSNTWIQLGQDLVGDPDDLSGNSVSLSADGTIVAIGAASNTSIEGRTRIYQYSSNGWTQLGQDLIGDLIKADPMNLSGGLVSLSADGTIVAIGVRHYGSDFEGIIRIYHLSEYFKSNVRIDGNVKIDNNLIVSNGNVGIGTTSPSTLLELSSNEPYLTLTNTTEENTDGGAESKIIFNDHSDTSLAQIQASHDGTSDDTKGDLIFSTNDGTSVNEALRIDYQGNVGIGTTDPGEKLEVNGNIKGTNFIGTLDNYNSSRFFRREGRTNTSTDIGPGWISVATCGGGRYAGEILVTDSRSVSHSYIRIHWMVSFSQTNFTVINSGGWINNITGVRVLYEPASYTSQTYGDKILQVYVGKTANYSVSIFRMGDDPYFGTFTAVTPVVENTKTNFSVRTELTDLHVYGFAHQKGILAGGDLKVNGLIHSRNNDTTYNSNVYDTTSYPECGMLFSGSTNNQWLLNPNDFSDLSLDFYSRNGVADPWDRAAYLDDNNASVKLNFTGQHRSILNKNIDETYIGLIVSSTGKYVNINNSLNTNINESLPICTITNIDNDIKVFGVISDKEDTNNNREYSSGNFVSSYKKTNNNEQRMHINSLGEGAIWVCNKNGNLVNGDYISSSSVLGYGMRQNTNKLLNSTVAKITCDCDFSLTKIVKQKLKVIITTETYEDNVFEETEKTQTKNIIEYDEELSRYVQKEITNTITETKQLYDTIDLYNETGEVIGTHQVERKQTKTRTIQNIDYDENGNVQYEDDLDENGNQQMIYPFETRFLLPDGTQITEEEYSTKKSLGEIVYIACFVGCTYHCG